MRTEINKPTGITILDQGRRSRGKIGQGSVVSDTNFVNYTLQIEGNQRKQHQGDRGMEEEFFIEFRI